MSVQDQLTKDEPGRPARALEEGDLVKIWVLETKLDVGMFDESSVVAAAVAAWENRIRGRGWMPTMASYAVGTCLCVLAHAVPNRDNLENRVADLEDAARALNSNLESLVKAYEQLQNQRVIRPV